MIDRRWRDDGCDPAEEQPVHDGRDRVGPLVAGVEADPDPERHQPARDRPGQHPQPVDGERQEAGGEHQRRERDDPRLDGVVEHRHLDQQAPHPLRRQDRHLEGDVGAEGGPADHGLRRPQVVEEGDDLLAERGHRVDERVGRPVGAPVAEQVEGDHVEPLGGQGTGQGLVHPARHQLAVEEHHPGVATAVLGVLEAVARGRVLDEELADALGDQHAGNLARGRSGTADTDGVRDRCRVSRRPRPPFRDVVHDNDPHDSHGPRQRRQGRGPGDPGGDLPGGHRRGQLRP